MKDRVVKTPKKLVSCHNNTSIAEILKENKTVGEVWPGALTY